MRTFTLIRSQDLSGISGIGVIAKGIAEKKRAILIWTSLATLADGSKKVISTKTYFKCWEDIVLLHGHGGKTILSWDDTKESVSDLDLLGMAA